MTDWDCCIGEFVVTKKTNDNLKKKFKIILLCLWIVIGPNRPRMGVSIQIPGLKLVEEESKINISLKIN
jgi:hypothetical protein